ncbi:hypothetical protein AU255_02675 [Methyloprofundus sedimenti]|uniref:Type II secretion system protein H n=1 Tax=Methyloprofundus sedimenti TaxID=1420851 RepID=A0A1V8MAQ9_9GAMM|nr:hypothetical protein AU255_02675 [Methyloprofundus sedimenti]
MTRLKQTGFTLTELMVVIAIVGILAAVAVPSFNDSIERSRLVSASEAVIADLRWARSEAIKRNRKTRVTYTTGASWSYTIIVDSNNNDTYGDTVGGIADETIKSVTGSNFPSTSISSVAFSSVAYTTFDPVRGTASAGNVILTSSAYSIKATVSTLGRTKLCAVSSSFSGYSVCP